MSRRWLFLARQPFWGGWGEKSSTTSRREKARRDWGLTAGTKWVDVQQKKKNVARGGRVKNNNGAEKRRRLLRLAQTKKNGKGVLEKVGEGFSGARKFSTKRSPLTGIFERV